MKFSVLRHTVPPGGDRSSHWDLLLEPPLYAANGSHSHPLLTFELPQWPFDHSNFPVRKLANHRRKYLEYSGHLDHERGSVQQIANGSIRWLLFEPGHLEFLLQFGPIPSLPESSSPSETLDSKTGTEPEPQEGCASVRSRAIERGILRCNMKEIATEPERWELSTEIIEQQE